MNQQENISKIENFRLQVVHEVGKQLLNVKEEKEVFKIIDKAIHQILPNSFYVISKLQDDDMNFRIVEGSDLDKYFKTLKKIIGKDPYTINFPFDNLPKPQLKSFESKELFYFKDGIYELVNGVLPKIICKAIERVFNIELVCAIAFNVEKKYYGGINLFIPKTTIKSGLFNEEAIMLIETISYQASAVIQRLRDRNDLKKKGKELQISQKKFNQLINQLNDVVWKANGDGSKIIDLSNSLKKFYGYTAEDFNKNPNFWIDVVHPEDCEIAKKSGHELLKTGYSEAEYRIIRPDNSIIWLHDRKSIVYNDEGKPIQMGGIASDITNRKKIEEQLFIKDFALETSHTAVGLADIKGKVFYVNNGYVKLWGYKNKQEIIGKHVLEFANSKKQVKEALTIFKKGRSYKSESIISRVDGTSINVLISADMVYSNSSNPICMIALFTDITNLKQYEQQLKNQAEKLKELNATKDKLFSIIAHDLKSPFNTILGFSQLLATEYENFTEEKKLYLINLINSSSKSAFALLENLLDWARLQSGQIKIKKEILDVRKLINESIEPYMPSAINKGINIEIKVPKNISIIADEETVKNAIHNIFNNAIKFSHSGDTIEFSAKKTNEFIEISIKDIGIGMSPETVINLFNINKNNTISGTNNEKGTGLGLIISKEFVAKNGGELHVESELGKGSIFKIVLPASIDD